MAVFQTLAPWTRSFVYHSANSSQEQVSTGASFLPSFLSLTSTPLLCSCVSRLSITGSLTHFPLWPLQMPLSLLFYFMILSTLSFLDPCGHWTQMLLLSLKPQNSFGSVVFQWQATAKPVGPKHTVFFCMKCHAPSSLGKMWIWITSTSFKLSLWHPFHL